MVSLNRARGECSRNARAFLAFAMVFVRGRAGGRCEIFFRTRCGWLLPRGRLRDGPPGRTVACDTVSIGKSGRRVDEETEERTAENVGISNVEDAEKKGLEEKCGRGQWGTFWAHKIQQLALGIGLT